MEHTEYVHALIKVSITKEAITSFSHEKANLPHLILQKKTDQSGFR